MGDEDKKDVKPAAPLPTGNTPFKQYVSFSARLIHQLTGWWYYGHKDLNANKCDEKEAALQALEGDLLVKTGLLKLIVSKGLEAWDELQHCNSRAFCTYDVV